MDTNTVTEIVSSIDINNDMDRNCGTQAMKLLQKKDRPAVTSTNAKAKPNTRH